MDTVPVYVISYNNGWLVEDTVTRLQHFAQQFVIIDNASRDPDTLAVLRRLDAQPHVSVWYLPRNWGPRCIFRPAFWSAMPDYFALTDPDLEYPEAMPIDFIEQLRRLTDVTGFFKAGLALDTSGPPEIFENYVHVEDTKQYWTEDRRADTAPGTPPIYYAPVDTTFAVYRKEKYVGNEFGPGLRVAGPYTVKHRPWYKEFWQTHAHRMQRTYAGAVYSTTAHYMGFVSRGTPSNS